MPYLEGRTFYDADSHLMELNGWLPKYADPSIREKIRPLYLGGAGAHAEQSIKDAEERRKNPEAALALEANLMNAKGMVSPGSLRFERASPRAGSNGRRKAARVQHFCAYAVRQR
jgi:hypothetical protein